jgi:hypothetical protein
MLINNNGGVNDPDPTDDIPTSAEVGYSCGCKQQSGIVIFYAVTPIFQTLNVVLDC